MKHDKVVLFKIPTMKPLEKNDGANTKSEGENQAVVTRNVSTNSARIDLSKVKIEPLFEEFVDFETFAKSDFRVVKFCIGLAAPDLPFCIVFG